MQYIVEDTSLKAIADKERMYLNETDLIPLTEMPSKVEDVYAKGYEHGRSAGLDEGHYRGYQEGYEKGSIDGKKAEYDEFWDTFQDYGKRTTYAECFTNYWTETNFKPKYDIIVSGSATNANNMFVKNAIEDLETVLNNCGVKLDTSGLTAFGQTFYNAYIKILPEIDATGAKGFNGYTFSSCPNLETIRKLKLKNDGSQTFATTTFQASANIVNIVIEGVIGQNGFNMQWSKKLSKASITSIINALSTTTSGLAITLSREAVNVAFEQYPNWNDGSVSPEWLALAGTRSNWTISLV